MSGRVDNLRAQITLNDVQRSVVDHQEGALLVLAPAGSGKTSLLAARLERALAQGRAPEDVLCLTFTNLAGRQLRDRVEQVAPESARHVWMSTFHGFCATLLRMEADACGLPCDFTICDEEDTQAILKSVMSSRNCLAKVNPAAAGHKDSCYTASDLLGLFDRAKSRIEPESLSLAGFDGEGLAEDWMRDLCRLHNQELRLRHALDFADLIYFARALFARRPEVRQKWGHRFSFIQVDEIQDTHLAEYEVIRALAGAGNIAVYGDLDQSIYGWRGAEPLRVKSCFVRDFKPAEFRLNLNYRATVNLIQAADAFSNAAFTSRHTSLVPAMSCPPGERIVSHAAANESAEAHWIADRIKSDVMTAGCRNRDIAVLCRTNRRAEEIGQVLSESGIPCLVADQYNFFRRQEVKDAVSAIRVLLDPHDLSAATRLALRHIKGVGASTVEQIMREGVGAGIRINDFLNSDTFLHDDPFGPVLEAFGSGRIAVIDTESTGLSTAEDEVVEVACSILESGKVVKEWSTLVKSAKSVGQSCFVHNITDAMLVRDGVAPELALGRLIEEIDGALVVGHNVRYDLDLIQSQAGRLGLEVPAFRFADTYALARRFVKSGSLRLGDLCESLKIATGCAHRALGDVQSTVELLHALIPAIREGVAARRALVARFKEKFVPAAAIVSRLRGEVGRKRPAVLLDSAVHELGIQENTSGEPARAENLRRLIAIFRARDETHRPPLDALRLLVQFASLGKHLDVLSEEEDRVIVAPVHQSKGMEFETVFIAGAVDGMMPIYRSEDLEEEKRLFYVAMTRPRKSLYVTGYKAYTTATGYVYPKSMTPYLKLIPDRLLRQVC